MDKQSSLKNKRIYQDRLIRKIAKEHGKDERVINAMVYSPLKFANRIISDPLDSRPIRIRYFGVFVLKHKEGKNNMFKDRVRRLKKDIGRTMVIMSSMGYMIQNEESVNRILDEALEHGDHEKIQVIWEEHRIVSRKK